MLTEAAKKYLKENKGKIVLHQYKTLLNHYEVFESSGCCGYIGTGKIIIGDLLDVAEYLA